MVVERSRNYRISWKIPIFNQIQYVSVVSLTNTHSIEHHPNWYHDIPVMHTLILGSYPPHEDRRHYEFYYPNKVNRFWNILAGIKGHMLQHFKGEEAVQERKQLMEDLQIGVQNTGLKISRKGKSAADNDIEIIEFQDILGIIHQHPELSRILMPGYSGKSSTVHSFIRYLKEQGINVGIPKPLTHGASFDLHIDQRIIECIVLTSTSPRVRMSLNDLIARFSPYIKKT